jgi:hypothetical protein
VAAGLGAERTGARPAPHDELSRQENPVRDLEYRVTGDEPVARPQKSYPQALAREAGRA